MRDVILHPVGMLYITGKIIKNSDAPPPAKKGVPGQVSAWACIHRTMWTALQRMFDLWPYENINNTNIDLLNSFYDLR